MVKNWVMTNLMSKMKTKNNLKKRGRKPESAQGNLMNQQPVIWDRNKKKLKGWLGKKIKVQ
jgi:hypothetical protein